MTLRLLAWLMWFFTATWVENAADSCKNQLAKGAHVMKKLGCFLTVLFLAAFVALPRIASAQDQSSQDQSTQTQAAQGQSAQQQNAQDQTAQDPDAQDQSAQSQDGEDQTPDPPTRVARLSYTTGSVSYQVSGDQDWVAADPNRPLTTNDNLWSDKDSFAEVHIGSTAIRMSSETGISILNLDDRTAQIQLAQGTIEIHLRNLEPGDAWEFDTPNLSFTLTSAGEYRVSTDPNSNVTTIIVREGAGQVTANGDSHDLQAGQQYTFTGTDQLAMNAQAAPAYDDFDNLCIQRDQVENNSQSAQYVSRDVDGYYDLDQNGTWSEVPDYGEVWIPSSVPSDWAPYQTGHWVWVAPWGWTWVDAEPWGWAPFHYGRWVLVGVHWGWVPGPRVVRPVYAPALVGFVGGHGFGVSVAFGGVAGVGWFPLGPRDVYVPPYRCSERYVQFVNVTNTRVVNVTRVRTVYNDVRVNRQAYHYTYENNSRAVVAVSRDTFVNARAVRTNAIRVNEEQLRNVRVVDNQRIAPARASYVSATARVSTARPTVPFSRRPVVARLAPPARGAHPVYTNDSATFSRPQGSANQGNRAPDQGNQGKRPGFHTFTPPVQRMNNGAPANGQTSRPNENFNRNDNNRQNQNLDNNRPNQNFNRNNNPPDQNFNRPNENSNRNDNRPNQNGNASENRPESHVTYAPPVRARDQNYDVHPPRNNSRTNAAPRTNAHPSAPKPSKPPKGNGKPR